MKTLTIALALFASTAVADEYEAERERAYGDAVVISSIKGDKSPCAVIGVQVANVMVQRLNGEPMSKQMNEPNLAFFHFVIRDAYSQPFYQTTEMKKQLVRDFRERYELECYEILGFNG
jgi:hypothetical protein